MTPAQSKTKANDMLNELEKRVSSLKVSVKVVADLIEMDHRQIWRFIRNRRDLKLSDYILLYATLDRIEAFRKANPGHKVKLSLWNMNDFTIWEARKKK